MITMPHFASFEETITFLNESDDELWELECEYDGIEIEEGGESE